MSKFEGLSAVQWMILEPLLPALPYTFGRPRPNRRKLLNTILYVLITSCRWCDVPIGSQWAKRSTAHEYLGKWEQEGVMYRVKQGLLELAELNGLIDWQRGSIDGSFPPGKGGRDDVGYGYKGKGVTNHLLVEGNGMPLAVVTTSAGSSARAEVINLIAQVRIFGTRRCKPRSCPNELQGDKGYDADELKNRLRSKGIKPMIPHRIWPHRKQRAGRKPPQAKDRFSKLNAVLLGCIMQN